LGQGCGVARRRFHIGVLARGVGWAGLTLAGVFVGLVALYAVAPPVSTLMLARKIEGKGYERTVVKLKDVSPAAVAAVAASEDATFCRNDGVDWDSLYEVLHRAGDRGRGASTITMQTAKNLFLWPGRSVIRKGVEIGMALILGKVWSKRRTMEVYLNIAQWGDGLFGVEAAAERYFHKKASQLDAREGALLATALPNPIKRNPAHPRLFQRRLAAHVEARALGSAEWLNCLRR
jgi:monofunctional biosynthetic peptidoglycan transglycosylase